MILSLVCALWLFVGLLTALGVGGGVRLRDRGGPR